MSPTVLQIFLLLNVFIIGAVTAIALQHLYAHFKHPHHEDDKSHPDRPDGHLPPAVKKQMLEASQANFQTVLDRSASQLQKDLETTEVQLNKQLEKLGSAVVSDEIERYKSELDQLRKNAETSIVNAQTEIAGHQVELKAKLVEEIAAEKERLIKQMDTKLADAVASFLMETMQHNVDLGAQSAYLTAMLEEHKEELIKGVVNET